MTYMIPILILSAAVSSVAIGGLVNEKHDRELAAKVDATQSRLDRQTIEIERLRADAAKQRAILQDVAVLLADITATQVRTSPPASARADCWTRRDGGRECRDASGKGVVHY